MDWHEAEYIVWRLRALACSSLRSKLLPAWVRLSSFPKIGPEDQGAASRRAFCERKSRYPLIGGHLSFSRKSVGFRSWVVVLRADANSLHRWRCFKMLLERKIILEESLVTMSAINQVGIPESESGRSQNGKPVQIGETQVYICEADRRA